MAKVGRKPMPTALRIVTGNPGGHPMPVDEPEPDELEKIDPPSWLSKEAKKYWRDEIGRLKRVGVLSEMDYGAFAALCNAYGNWQIAEMKFAAAAKDDTRHAAIIIETSLGNWVQNPLLCAARSAMNNYTKLLVEFGMTPSSRARVRTEKQPNGKTTKAKSYLTG